MRLHEVISEDFDLEEGPIWDKTRQVGAAVGKGLGAVGQGIGAVAGVPAGIARSIKKGYNRASDTIAGGPDETPQQGGGTQYQPSGQQQSAAGQAQAVAGQSAEDPATLRKQARDLMARADEIERQQKQTSQSAPSQQTTQPNQSTGNATSGQTQNTGTGQQAQQTTQTQQEPQAEPNQTQQEPQAQQTTQTQQEPQAEPNQTQQEPQAQQTTQAPANNVSTPSSTGGSYNNQIGNGKANYSVTTNFDPKTMQNVSTPLDPKAVSVVPNTTNPTTNNKDAQANLKDRLRSGQGMGKKGDSGFKKSGVGKPVQKIVGADKQGAPVVSTVREDIQYYSRFLRAMI